MQCSTVFIYLPNFQISRTSYKVKLDKDRKFYNKNFGAKKLNIYSEQQHYIFLLLNIFTWVCNSQKKVKISHCKIKAFSLIDDSLEKSQKWVKLNH